MSEHLTFLLAAADNRQFHVEQCEEMQNCC